MELLVAHMMGDYFFQNTWMATNKTKRTLPCLIHCLIYTLCVCVICGWFNWKLIVVFGTHFLLDRFRLAKYWRRFFDHNEELIWIIISDNCIHLLILLILSLI